jgi:signal transduction histidine kinase
MVGETVGGDEPFATGNGDGNLAPAELGGSEAGLGISRLGQNRHRGEYHEQSEQIQLHGGSLAGATLREDEAGNLLEGAGGFANLQLMSEIADAPASAVAELPRRKGTLLIVDDEDGPRVSLQVIFRGDYEILLASDGPTAIKIAEQQRVDVAVCDIKMQGMSGIEVLERLKFVDPGIEVVMMTAFETTETIRKALQLRACDYVNKPFDLARMREIVAAAMQRRTLESEILTNSEKLRELTEELQNHKVQQQIAQTRGDIYASIIHDINGPLTVISGFLQMINQRISGVEEPSGKDLDFTRDKLKVVTRQVTNCIEISRRYLHFLRKQADDMTPRVGVNQLLTDLKHLMRVHPALLENQLHIEPLTTDIGVRMNGTDFIQSVLNLAVNGLQCSPQPHRVDITGDVLQAPLQLEEFKDTPATRLMNVEGLNNTAPLLRLAVRDNGPGIAAEVLPKIFDTYFTTKGPRQGTGLGLNIVLRMIRDAGGALHVGSQAGVGTTFTLYLPAAELAKT